MDYDESFDEEQMTKLLNSQLNMLNNKFKLYEKMIYEENPNKSKNSFLFIKFTKFYCLITKRATTIIYQKKQIWRKWAMNLGKNNHIMKTSKQILWKN
jgi:hypothetical protein